MIKQEQIESIESYFDKPTGEWHTIVVFTDQVECSVECSCYHNKIEEQNND